MFEAVPINRKLPTGQVAFIIENQHGNFCVIDYEQVRNPQRARDARAVVKASQRNCATCAAPGCPIGLVTR